MIPTHSHRCFLKKIHLKRQHHRQSSYPLHFTCPVRIFMNELVKLFTYYILNIHMHICVLHASYYFSFTLSTKSQFYINVRNIYYGIILLVCHFSSFMQKNAILLLLWPCNRNNLVCVFEKLWATLKKGPAFSLSSKL